MIKILFISILVTTNVYPSQGWIQWSNRSYQDRELCMKSISNSYDQIAMSVRYLLGDKLVQIMEMRCMTRQEAIFLNYKLGHKQIGE